MITRALGQLLLPMVEKSGFGNLPREAGAASVSEEDSAAQTENAFSGNSEILPLALASLW